MIADIERLINSYVTKYYFIREEGDIIHTPYIEVKCRYSVFFDCSLFAVTERSREEDDRHNPINVRISIYNMGKLLNSFVSEIDPLLLFINKKFLAFQEDNVIGKMYIVDIRSGERRCMNNGGENINLFNINDSSVATSIDGQVFIYEEINDVGELIAIPGYTRIVEVRQTGNSLIIEGSRGEGQYKNVISVITDPLNPIMKRSEVTINLNRGYEVFFGDEFVIIDEGKSGNIFVWNIDQLPKDMITLVEAKGYSTIDIIKNSRLIHLIKDYISYMLNVDTREITRIGDDVITIFKL